MARPAASPTPTPAPTAKTAPPPSYYEPMEVPREPEVQRRVRLMDSALPAMSMSGKYGPGSEALPLTFLAFTRAPVGGDTPRAGNHPVYHLTLLEQPLHLELSPGPFTLPALLTPPTLLMQTGGIGGGSNGAVYWSEMQSGYATYGFRPLLPGNAQVEALVLGARQFGQSFAMADMSRGAMPSPSAQAVIPAEFGVFSVYNWQSGTWDPLPTGAEQVALQPAPYLSADGQVQVRVQAETGRVVRFLAPELTVEGRVSE